MVHLIPGRVPLLLGTDRQRSATARVLVVDDDPALRAIVVDALELEGYEVRAAPNGGEALEVLRGWRPSVIVLDLMMPGLDGWAFRARQVAHEAWARIPVIVMSASYNLEHGAEALGPAALLPKPFELEALLEAIRRLA